jgi:TonB-linked SusC/RagA family outer membrane protein
MFYGLTIQCMFVSVMIASDLNAQKIESVKEVYLSLSLKDANVVEAFKAIEQQTDFKFAYDHSVINKKLKLNVRSGEMSVADLLLQISKDAGLKFRQVNNYINVDRLDKNQKVLEVNLQARTVMGRVTTEEDGEGLPGVNVIVKGTSQGTVSDIEGRYSLDVPDDNAVLVYSSVGYIQEEVEVGGRSVIDLTMVQDITALDEIVVVGYGTQKKKDLTSAISTVKGETLQTNKTANWSTALQGIAPGVEVQGNQGRPGAGATIRIRGVGSISGATNPLVVVDGIPMGSDAVAPQDIESVEVLKDAASTAIYGSRGANGVILITTKSGATLPKGKVNVSLNSYAGVEEPAKQLDFLNAEQWAQLAKETNENAASTPPQMATWILNNDPNYDGTDSDWQDAMFQQGVIQEHQLSISGNSEAGNFYISGGYFSQEGIMVRTDYERFNLRINSNWRKGRFTFGESIGFRQENNEDEDVQGGRSHIEEMMKQTAPVKIYDSTRLGGYGGPTGSDGHDAANPYGVAHRRTRINHGNLFTAALWGEYEIIDGLRVKTNLGYQNDIVHTEDIELQSDFGPKSIDRTRAFERMDRSYRWAWENTLTYSRSIGDHDFTGMVGYTSEYAFGHDFSAEGFDIDSEELNTLNLIQANPGVNGGEDEWALTSILARVMYSYKGRYLITANWRRDGTSRFAEENRFGNFPSVSVGWHLGDEPFMSGVEAISNLKLRASYGTVGNQNPVGNYARFSRLRAGANYTFADGATGKLIGVVPRQFANPNLQWESVTQTDIGLDLGLFNEALTITADYYIKDTDDMLVSVPIPESSGSLSGVSMNAGSIRNQGFEFMATYRHSFGDFNLDLSGNFATLHNEVLSLGVEGAAITGANVEFNNQGVSRTEAGHPVGAFYGYYADGIFQSEEEVLAHTSTSGAVIQPAAKPGDIRFRDVNDDGTISPDDRRFIGSPMPDLTYGFRIAGDWKGFDFDMFFQGTEGNDIYAELMAWTQGMHNNFNATTAVLDRWTPNNASNTIPRAVRNDPNSNIKNASTRYIQDGSYLRMRSLMIGYSLPKTITESLSLQNIRFYFVGRNLLTFTDYPFYDPEIGSNAVGTGGNINTSRGVDNGYYPQARSYMLGIQIDF